LILQPGALPAAPEVARLDIELENAEPDEARRPQRIHRLCPLLNRMIVIEIACGPPARFALSADVND
jgi:hypothetical protein